MHQYHAIGYQQLYLVTTNVKLTRRLTHLYGHYKQECSPECIIFDNHKIYPRRKTVKINMECFLTLLQQIILFIMNNNTAKHSIVGML